jgi:arylsulfatase A
MKARFRDQDLADEWVKSSRAWISANKAKPFFLYFAAHDIHVPRAPHERFLGKSGMGPRGDSILEFDWCVGELMKTLDENCIAENTLIILCSDNGPVLDDGYKDDAVEKIGKHQAAGTYRGGKYSVFEGGTRTPFISRWKGKIKPAVSDNMVCTIDLAASCSALAGVNLPADACIDSLNLLPALLGEASAKGRSHILQQDNNGKALGLRVGDWKLVRQVFAKQKKEQLFNLSLDSSEKKNVAKENPEKLEQMRQQLDSIIEKRTR